MLDLVFPLVKRLIQAASSWSLLLTFLHSLWVPHSYKRVAEVYPQSHPAATLREGKLLKTIIINMVLALGGGTIAALLQGNPVGWVLSDTLIPMYLVGFFLVHYLPLTHYLLTKLSPLSHFFFDCIIDGLVRTFAMTAVMNNVMKSSEALGSTSYFGLIFLGFISVTGGGIAYRWSCIDAFTLPNIDFLILWTASTYYAVILNEKASQFVYAMNPLIFDTLYSQVARKLGLVDLHRAEEARAVVAVLIILGFIFRFKPLDKPRISVPTTNKPEEPEEPVMAVKSKQLDDSTPRRRSKKQEDKKSL